MLLWTPRPVVMLIAMLGLLCAASAAFSDGASDPIRFYLDADRTNATASGDAIEAGMRVAVGMQGGRVSGRPIEFVMLDHRGNTRRSKRSLEKFAADPNGLAIFTGLHSPPVLNLRDTINGQKLLMLDPWAAAGPITRPESEENWIFRLSVDDANAGQFIAESALAAGVRRPGLLLEETGWGKANNHVMTRTVVDALGREPARRWFSWGNSEQAVRLSVNELIDEEVDAIFFVGNTPEGAKLIKILADWDADVRPVLYSHWGILGGGLLDHVTLEDVRAVDLKFIQTRFDLGKRDEEALPRRAFEEAKRLGFFEGLRHPDEMPAPTGFVHAFDLMRILLSAIEQAGLSGDVHKDREAVRQALEHLRAPVNGIIKTYVRPFEPYRVIGSDAHEALGIADYTLACFGPSGKIERVTEQSAAEPDGVDSPSD